MLSLIESNDKIILDTKPVGLTSKDFADVIKNNNNYKKICYCGRLDPMARGEMLFLANDNCKEMEKHLNHDKEYEFEIILGLKTDTDDPLGLIVNYNTNIISINNLIDLLESFKYKEIDQNFHKYSSIMINSNPYWLKTKNDEIVKKNQNI